MIESQTIARPYAKAAFAFANTDSKQLENWLVALKLISSFVQEEALLEFVKSPVITNEVKLTKLISLDERFLDTNFSNFLQVLTIHKRLPVLPRIYSLFQEYKNTAENSLIVNVETAINLSEAQKNTLTNILEKRLNTKVDLHVTENPDLIGGLIIRTVSEVIDYSISGQLMRFAGILKT